MQYELGADKVSGELKHFAVRPKQRRHPYHRQADKEHTYTG